MAIVCPRCTVPAELAADLVGSGERMLRCKRCGTAWRFSSAGQFVDGGRPPLAATVRWTGRPRFERVIEHGQPQNSWRAAAKAVRPAEWRDSGKASLAGGRFARSRHLLGSWLGVIAAVLASILVAMLALGLSSVGASPGDDRSQFSGLEIRLVRAAVEPGRGGRTVVVVGEIANRTNDEITVPAVRIALRSDGSERHSWYHQPAETRLAAGGKVLFRSTLAAPPADVDEVTFRLAARHDAGMP